MAKRVVICGGTGFIGHALYKLLDEAGYEVVIVTRNPKPGQYSWDQLPQAIEGSCAVVNLAGHNIACKFTPENKRLILSSRIESAKNISAAIAQCTIKPEKWINASATGFYGDRGDETLNESSPAGTGFLAETCIAWENACFSDKSETKKTVIRIGVVLANGQGVLRTLVPLAKAFLGGAAGNGNQWVPWIHIQDIARLIHFAIDHGTPAILSGSSPNPVQNKDFMAWLRRINHRPWSPNVPTPVMKLIGDVIGPDASLVLTSCRIISTQPADFQFKYPTLKSISATNL